MIKYSTVIDFAQKTFVLFSLLIFNTIGANAQEDKFIFEYLGPDTVAVGNGCEGILNWDTMNNPIITPLDPIMIDSIQIIISDDYVIDGFVPAGATVTVIYRVFDNMGDSTDFEFTIAFTDQSPPVFNTSMIPDQVSITCKQIVSLPPNSVTDNCTPTELIEISFTDSDTLSFCTEMSFTRTWKAADEAGNEGFLVQEITAIPDVVDPEITSPAVDLTHNCSNGSLLGAFDAWLDIRAGAVATDDCSAITWTTIPANPVLEGACNSPVQVTFVASDACGNSTSTTASFLFNDNTGPTIDVLPQDTAYVCDGSEVFGVFRAWLLSGANVQTSDNCLGEGELLISYKINDEEVSLDQLDSLLQVSIDAPCEDDVDINGESFDSVLGLLAVTFVYSDFCDQSVEAPATFAVIDNAAPFLTNPAQDTTIQCREASAIITELTEWVESAGGAQGTDDCGFTSFRADPPLAGAIALLNSSQNASCGNSGNVTVSFYLRDGCGNELPAPTIATFTIIDTIPPVMISPPADVTIDCAATLSDDIDAQLNDFLGAEITDECGSIVLVSFDWTDSNDQSGTGDPSDPETYPFPSSDNCEWSVTVTLKVSDECGNEITLPSAVLSVEDNDSPIIINFPADVTVDCSDIPEVAEPVVDDNCRFNLNFVLTETDTKGTDPDDCSSYTYTLSRKWTITDACGNSVEQTQQIFIQDETGPEINFDESINLNCGDDVSPPDEPLDSIVDACGSPVSYVLVEFEFPGTCPGSYRIERQWTATDVCGNSSALTQQIFVNDNTDPAFTIEPQDLLLTCEDLGEVLNDYESWLNKFANAAFTDACGDAQIFAAEPGSYDIEDPSTFPGNSPANPGNPSCDGEAVLQKIVDFVIYDGCGNAHVAQAELLVIDDVPPQIEYCPEDISVIVADGECEAFITVSPPLITDLCLGTLTTDTSAYVAPIFSLQSGNIDVPVEPVILEFTVSLGSAEALTLPVTLNIRLNNTDAEATTEYFNIFDEDGELIGITQPVNLQCGAGTTQFSAFTSGQMNSWIQDGKITFRMEPNIVTGQPGRFSVNDICGGSFVEADLIYTTAKAEDAVFTYSINAGPANPLDPAIGWSADLSAGTYSVRYNIADCFGNIATCLQNIEIIDDQAPSITCPDDMVFALPSDSCIVGLTLNLPFDFEDNCGLPIQINETRPGSLSDAFLIFDFDPDLNDYLARDKTVTFDGLFNTADSEFVRLSIALKANTDEEGAFFSIYDPDDFLLGTTEMGQAHVINGDCENESIITFDLPILDFNRWASTGSLSFRAVSNVEFGLPPGGLEVGINPCIRENVTMSGQVDSSSYMYMTLEYGAFDVAYSVIGSTIVPMTILTGADRRPHVNFNSGLSTVEYTVYDNSGNSGSCSFDINIIDDEPPVASCQSTIVFIHPSGLDTTTLLPELIDAGSSDNCGIVEYSVSPDEFSCSQVGEEIVVALTVTDAAGNSSSCQTIVRIETAALNPLYSIDICENDSLQLFANVPVSPSGSAYTYSWEGPNNFSSNQENPVIANVSPDYSGTYILTVTGIGGCVSTGTVTVQIPVQPGVPDLFAVRDTVCQGDLIQLSTQEVGDGAVYKWYRGQAPGGTFLDSTLAPGYNLTLPAGTYSFYVQVNTRTCSSPPSISKEITVLAKQDAIVTAAFVEVCEGQLLTIGTPTVGPNISYSWTGPFSFQDTVQNPVITQTASLFNSGEYTLFIFENGCASNPGIVEVNVKPRPDTPVLSSNAAVCPGEDLILSINNIDEADTYTWTHPTAPPIMTPEPELVLNNISSSINGIWTVFATLDGCNSQISNNLIIDVEVSYNFMASNDGPICSGDSVTLFATNVMGATYEWFRPDNSNAGVGSTLRIVPVGGTYRVEMTSPKGCEYEGITNVEVRQSPNITAVSVDADQCVTGTSPACFAATVVPDIAGNIYDWKGPGNYQSSLPEPCRNNVTSAMNGAYTLVVTNIFGCISDTSTVILNVKDIPARPVLNIEPFYCEGQEIIISTSDYGPGATYSWVTPFGTPPPTNVPRLTIDSGNSAIHNGAYQVRVTIDNCTSDGSVLFNLMLRPSPARPVIAGSAVVCEGDTLKLSTVFAPGAEYIWTGPGGFNSADQNPSIFPAVLANSGNYQLEININGCSSAPSTPFQVTVTPKPVAPGLNAINASVCGNSPGAMLELCINEADIVAGGLYTWYWAETDEVVSPASTSRCIQLTDLSRFNAGLNTFYVIANIEGCRSNSSIPINVNIDYIPAATAFGGPDLVSCNADEVFITAITPTLGVGSWAIIDPFLNIESPNSISTTIFGLRPGLNRVQWSLSEGACLNFSSDTVSIFYQIPPIARNDQALVSYAGVVTIDVVNNDDIPTTYTIDILRAPQYGNLIPRVDENFDFRADPNFVGDDYFTYRICAVGCPDLCSEARVDIRIGDDSDCEIPTIITPNDDGINDVFFIPCLSSDLFPNNKVTIFNEQGSAVFEESPYQNNWKGTYRGEDLPIGTYFFVVDFADGSTPRNGFVIIKR